PPFCNHSLGPHYVKELQPSDIADLCCSKEQFSKDCFLLMLLIHVRWPPLCIEVQL
ncbi:hypothetical protein U1Q18_037785, partial [Sarracenia purpurea var. burkii]